MMNPKALENLPVIADAIAAAWLVAAREGILDVPIPEAISDDDRLNRLSQRVETVLFTFLGGLSRLED